ncbi:sulfite exporter TauE/SafE family protein [Paenibacillus elgii]|uniref:sulfite exporter TauE/SafE family protein n=1 Tax=Paenibacillus elgii TaxID=189691 RepID=UPI000248CD8E|nr:sulfite exporter TauE/SafE family protein [Paenibacillus elgii]
MAIGVHDLTLAWLAGLLGAPHCIGMCGATVSGFALQAKGSPLRSVLAYNAGRIVTYAALGAFMGTIGSFVDGAGKLANVQGTASLLGGCLILLWALRRTALPLHRLDPHRLPLVRRLTARYRTAEEAGAAFVSGLLLGFLPCGLTYAMEMNAAASASPLHGLLLMLLFGLGTVPALVSVGLFAGKLNKRLRSKATMAGQFVAVWIGVLSVLRGLAAAGWIPSVHPWLW